MANENFKMLKYKRGENSLKAPSMIYGDLQSLLKNYTHVEIMLKNLLQIKKICIKLMVIQCLQIVHLTQRSSTRQKISLIVT